MASCESCYEAARIPFLMSLVIGGNIGLPLILLGICFSKTVVRHPVFTNWCITWVIFSTVYLLLFYAGQFNNSQPNFALCLIQGAMIYSSDAMIGVSSFVLVFYIDRVVHRGFQSISQGKEKRAFGSKFTAFLLSAPYLMFFIVFIIETAAGVGQPQSVHRSHFYCTIGLPIAHLGPGVAAGLTTLGVILLAVTLARLFRHRRRQGELKNIIPAGSGIDLSLILRVFLFAALTISGAIITVAFLFHIKGPMPNILLSLGPVIMTATFGTSPDLLRVYFFCRRSTVRKEDIVV